MDFKDLVFLIEVFLSSSITTSDIEKYVGRVIDDRNPQGLILSANRQSIEFAKLGLVEIDGDLIPEYLFMRFNPAQRVLMQQFLDRYGIARKGVRLKPNQPVPHYFEFEGSGYKGEIMVGYASGDTEQLMTVRISRKSPLK